MLLKVNNLTNLADARYSAAYGADYLCLSLERGSPYKLSPAAIAEMLQWLEGPQVVLAFGADAEGAMLAEGFLREHKLPIEIDIALLPALDRAELADWVIGVRIPHTMAATEAVALLQASKAAPQYAELLLNDAAQAEAYQQALPPQLQLLFDSDNLVPAHIEALALSLTGLSYGRTTPESHLQLDYDGLEHWLLRLSPHKMIN